MNLGRRKTDEFLYKVKQDLIGEDPVVVLELGTGVSPELSIMFMDNPNFHATDKDIYPGCVPGITKLDAECYSGPLMKEQYRWDAIFFCESLEHCAHPWHVFREAFFHLQVGGFFIVTAPCYYPIHEGYTGEGEGHVEVKDYWRFTPSGLAQLFEDASFGVYHVEPLYHEGDDLNKPYSIVGWGQTGVNEPEQLTGWNPTLPDDWVERHEWAEKKWLESIKER